MSIKAGIKTTVEAVSAASSAGLTVYYGHAPQQATYPYGVLNRVSGGDYAYTQSGNQNRLREVFQLDLYHSDDEALETIRNAIISTVNGAGPATWSDVSLKSCTVTDSRDLTELETEGGEVAVVRHMIELTTVYTT